MKRGLDLIKPAGIFVEVVAAMGLNLASHPTFAELLPKAEKLPHAALCIYCASGRSEIFACVRDLEDSSCFPGIPFTPSSRLCFVSKVS